MADREWTVEDVAGLLKDQDGTTRTCCLLIGAGVSRTAGIGTSSDFVRLIESKHPVPFARASRAAEGRPPSYAQCMGELTEGQQAALVREQVERAKINWAHIGIGRLEAAGFVDRILTTNFDPLASRACALFNRFPAVYDLAALRDADLSGGRARFLPSFVRGSAIYHLHGQHTGFMLLNTSEKLEAQAKRIEPALEEAIEGRTVIVCGYSGENDPLVDRLSRQDVYPNGLVWVCHDEKYPCGEVVEKLLDRIDDCRLVLDMPSDKFFTELANALETPQPSFLISPFSHMRTVLDQMRPFSDVTEGRLDLVHQAKFSLSLGEKGQAQESPHGAEIAVFLARGDYLGVLERFEPLAATLTPIDRHLLAWAPIMLAISAAVSAEDGEIGEAGTMYDEAIGLLKRALLISPDHDAANLNWGIILLDRSRCKVGARLRSDLNGAERRCLKAREFGSRHAAYNLACVEARRKNLDEVAKWLRISEAEGALPNRTHIMQDRDFAEVRDEPAIKELLEEISSE